MSFQLFFSYKFFWIYWQTHVGKLSSKPPFLWWMKWALALGLPQGMSNVRITRSSVRWCSSEFQPLRIAYLWSHLAFKDKYHVQLCGVFQYTCLVLWHFKSHRISKQCHPLNVAQYYKPTLHIFPCMSDLQTQAVSNTLFQISTPQLVSPAEKRILHLVHMIQTPLNV